MLKGVWSVITINVFRSERLHRLSKEGFWIVLGQIVAMTGSLVGVRMMTGLMSPSAYGELALGITVATLVVQTVIGPLINGITRFYASAVEQNDLDDYFSAVRQWVQFATKIIIYMILSAVFILLLSGRAAWIGIVIASFTYAIFSGYNSILSGILNAARQRSIVALHQAMEPWARILIVAALLLWLGATGTVAMAGSAMAAMLVLVSQYSCFYKRGFKNIRWANNERIWREKIWKYSLPFASWGIFSWAQQASDRWALGLFSTTQEVGFYAVLFQLGYQPIAMATGMTMQFLSPIFFQRAGDANDSQRNSNVTKMSWRLTGLALGMTGAVFLITLLCHKQIFIFFVAREYWSVSYLLPWMLLAGGVFSAGQTISLNLMSQMKTQSMMSAKIVTALLGVTLNFVGAYWYGTTGIVIAGVLFSVSYFIWIVLISMRTNAYSINK